MSEDVSRAEAAPPDVRPLRLLPCDLAEQFKWLCWRASEAAAHVARREASEAADAALQGLVHGLALELAPCPALSVPTRRRLQRLAWLALAAICCEDVRAAYGELRGELLSGSPDLHPSLAGHLVAIAEAAAAHAVWARLRSRPESGRAWEQLTRVAWSAWRCYWGRPPWRGANFGGWLLLEPGPSAELWEEAAAGQEVDDEHGLCLLLPASRREEVLEAYRLRWLSEEEFKFLAKHGLNAIRVPFGYWVVTGPSNGEPFVGPALEHLDRVVDLAERFGTQVLLDLHGNPGGESGDRPCGRSDKAWTEASWRRAEALEVLAAVARRYAGRKCVTGLQVANEPSRRCAMGPLCSWFEDAIKAIRGAGMRPDDVAVVLPVYGYDRLEEFVTTWMARGNFLRFENVALDLHYYHCFGRGWDSLDHEAHLALVERHGRALRSLPGAVVGEWSLARPEEVSQEDAAVRAFGEAQLRAYGGASHGWFFWNFCDGEDLWDLSTCVEQGWLPRDLGSPPPSPGVAAAAGGEAEAQDSRPEPGPPPGRFPHCYGAEERRLVLGAAGGAPAATLARGLAEALGCSRASAAQALEACGGDEAAAATLLLGDPASSPEPLSPRDSAPEAAAAASVAAAGAAGEEQAQGQKRPRSPST